MALISLAQFEARHEEDLDATEQIRVTTLIDDASALIVAAVKDSTVTDTWDPNAAPDAVVPVIYRMVRRAFVNPDGMESETIGSYTWRRGREPGIFMTKEERREVRRAAGQSMTSMTLQSPYTGARTSWLDGAL